MNYGAAYIIAAACIGYSFCSLCYYCKYGLARKSGYYSYLYCTSIGLIFLTLSMVIDWSFFKPDWVPAIPGFVSSDDASDKFMRDILVTACIAMLAVISVNIFHPKPSAIATAWKDDLNKMLALAIELDSPIQISLDSRKVYIGHVFDTIEPDKESSFLTIIPVLGGYREEKTLSLRLTHKYEEIIGAMKKKNKNLERYRLVIPRSNIVTAHIFNPSIHKQVHEKIRTS